MKNLEKKSVIDEIIGQVFGKWTIGQPVTNRYGYYHVTCLCGYESTKSGWQVKNGKTTQCFRCRKKEMMLAKRIKFDYGLDFNQQASGRSE